MRNLRGFGFSVFLNRVLISPSCEIRERTINVTNLLLSTTKRALLVCSRHVTLKSEIPNISTGSFFKRLHMSVATLTSPLVVVFGLPLRLVNLIILGITVVSVCSSGISLTGLDLPFGDRSEYPQSLGCLKF